MTLQHFLFPSGYNNEYTVCCLYTVYARSKRLDMFHSLIFPVSSWCTTAPFRSQQRSCAACQRTGRSPGLSPHCPCSTLWAERWCRRSTQKTTRLPACHSCRPRRKCSSDFSLPAPRPLCYSCVQQALRDQIKNVLIELINFWKLNWLSFQHRKIFNSI